MKSLDGVAKAIVVGVTILVGLADVVFQIWLFTSGRIGWGIAYFFVGWPLTLTVGYWIAMLLATPFAATAALSDRSSERLLKSGRAISSSARWDTGPLLSSEQCEGTVFAMSEGLHSSALSGTTATIPWSHLESFAVAQHRDEMDIKTGAPWFWNFRLQPNDAAHCQQWEDVLTSNGVVQRD